MLAGELPKLARFRADVELFTNETDVQVLASDDVPPAARSLFGRLGTRDPIEYAGFRVSRGSFFQVNRFLIERLVEAATGRATGGMALALYACVGLFSGALKTGLSHVVAVEAGRSAHRDLEFNVPGLAGLHATPERVLTELRG